MVQAYALAWRRTSEGLLLNIAHSGLESLEYGFQMSRRSLRGVFFLHDLIPLSHPEYCRAGEDGRHQRRLQTMLSAGRGLVVNSAATRDALEAHAVSLGHRVPRCVVAPLPPAHFPAPGRGQPLEKPYFVVLGTIEPRKNHLLLLQVWRQLVEELGESAPHLVIVGQRGWECEQVVEPPREMPGASGERSRAFTLLRRRTCKLARPCAGAAVSVVRRGFWHSAGRGADLRPPGHCQRPAGVP